MPSDPISLEQLLAELEQLREENAKLKELDAQAVLDEHPGLTHFGLVQGRVSAATTEKNDEEGAEMGKEKTQKWYQDAGGLWPQPRILRDTDMNDTNYEHERAMTWSELFFDLIFVVAIARLGEQLKDESAVDVDVFGFFIYFQQFWCIWYNCANYGNQFGTNDLPNMLFFSTVMGCVCFMTTHLTGGDTGPNIQGFCASALAACVAQLAVTCRVWNGVNRERGWGSCRMLTIRISGPAICYLLATIFGGDSPEFCWRMLVLAQGIDLVIFRIGLFCIRGGCVGVCVWRHFIGGRRNEKGEWVSYGFVPFHLEHINERVGLLVIIFLGDNVDNITDAYSPTIAFFFVVFAAFVVIVCLKNLYFDVDDQDIDYHAIRRSPTTTMTWWLCVCSLCFGIALFGNGLCLVCENVSGKEQSLEARRQPIMCSGLAVVLLSMTGVSLSHKREWHDRKLEDGSMLTMAAILDKSPKMAFLRRLFVVQQVSHFTSACIIAAMPLAGLGDLELMAVLAGLGVALVILNLVDEVVELGCKDAGEAQEVRQSSVLQSLPTSRLSRKRSSQTSELGVPLLGDT